jgi:hypothetical protein
MTHGDGSSVVDACQRPRLTWTVRPALACSRRWRDNVGLLMPVIRVSSLASEPSSGAMHSASHSVHSAVSVSPGGLGSAWSSSAGPWPVLPTSVWLAVPIARRDTSSRSGRLPAASSSARAFRMATASTSRAIACSGVVARRSMQDAHGWFHAVVEVNRPDHHVGRATRAGHQVPGYLPARHYGLLTVRRHLGPARQPLAT